MVSRRHALGDSAIARYQTTIDSSLAPAVAFVYMASFDNALEWDPSVVESARLDASTLGIGSAFRIVSKFAGRRVPLRYEITGFEPGRRVVLEAWNRSFGSVDTITVVPAPRGSEVTYDARLVLNGVIRVADPLMQRVFKRVGKAADVSLRFHLNRPH